MQGKQLATTQGPCEEKTKTMQGKNKDNIPKQFVFFKH
jgi:hypothetical protein